MGLDVDNVMMTPDQYVEAVLAKYAVLHGPNSPAERFGAAVAAPLRAWAGVCLNELQYSGSYAKKTGVHGISDVDVFISLKSSTPDDLKSIFNSLLKYAGQQGWSPRAQNVSVGVTLGGVSGDLVPGKIQDGYQNYHSLYVRKRDSWTQTNPELHIQRVNKSGCLREIRAVKIWRYLRGLDFPSLYLELFTINAMAGRLPFALADNVLHVLRTIGLSLPTARIEDPANTNNVLSDDLTGQEKKNIAMLAWQSSQEASWGRIIW